MNTFLNLKKVVRPDLVEMHDVTAKDPVLLLDLKVRFYTCVGNL